MAILIDRNQGWTYRELAKKYNITRQRANQIVKQLSKMHPLKAEALMLKLPIDTSK